jgi:hypothetical protein
MYILEEIIYMEYLKILIQKNLLYYFRMNFVVKNAVKNLIIIIGVVVKYMI